MTPFTIIDAHEDISYNALSFGRDYTLSAAEIRASEVGSSIPALAGDALLGWNDYQRGQVALTFATLFVVPERYKEGAWDALSFSNCREAYQHTAAQVDYYQRLTGEHPEKFRLVTNRSELGEVLQPWDESPADPPAITHPVGLVLSMEGAEGLCSPGELEEWWQAGLRLVGPVWAGTRYCGGMKEYGPFTSEGYALLDIMAELGYILDVAHMTDSAIHTALDRYEGPIICSHANVRSLQKSAQGERHLTDSAIRRLAERGAVIGLIPFSKFLHPDWQASDPRSNVTLQHYLAHIDYICQITGSAAHAGIGSDFDGGFGWPAVPQEIDTLADLQKLAPLMAEKGYTEDEIAAILGGNWRSMLERNLPE